MPGFLKINILQHLSFSGINQSISEQCPHVVSLRWHIPFPHWGTLRPSGTIQHLQLPVVVWKSTDFTCKRSRSSVSGISSKMCWGNSLLGIWQSHCYHSRCYKASQANSLSQYMLASYIDPERNWDLSTSWSSPDVMHISFVWWAQPGMTPRCVWVRARVIQTVRQRLLEMRTFVCSKPNRCSN